MGATKHPGVDVRIVPESIVVNLDRVIYVRVKLKDSLEATDRVLDKTRLTGHYDLIGAKRKRDSAQ